MKVNLTKNTNGGIATIVAIFVVVLVVLGFVWQMGWFSTLTNSTDNDESISASEFKQNIQHYSVGETKIIKGQVTNIYATSHGDIVRLDNVMDFELEASTNLKEGNKIWISVEIVGGYEGFKSFEVISWGMNLT